MKKSNVAWLFVVIVLSLLLVLSIVLGVTGYYFSISYLYSNSDLKIGETVSIGVEPNQSNIVSFTFDGAYLPKETLPQVIQINGLDLNANVRVRVKAKVFGLSDDTNFDFVTTEHFEKAADGYYYYDNILQGGNKITFCNFIIFPETGDFSSNEKYILSIVIETLESKYENIWQNNP